MMNCPKCLDMNSLFSAFDDEHVAVADPSCDVCGGSGTVVAEPAQPASPPPPPSGEPAVLRGRGGRRDETVGQKADRLLDEQRVVYVGREEADICFVVAGDNDEYHVRCAPDGWTCQCKSRWRCSHVIACGILLGVVLARELRGAA